MTTSRKWWEPTAEEPHLGAEDRNDAGYLDPACLMAGGMHGWVFDRIHGNEAERPADHPPRPRAGVLRRCAALLMLL